MTNRTLQFYGYAYGNVPVQLNAHINGELVFSGAVDAIDEPINYASDMTKAPVLFSVASSDLFPIDFSGSCPMTVSVATGLGVQLGNVYSNYMPTGEAPAFTDPVELINTSITGTTLNVGTVQAGTVKVGQALAAVTNTGILIPGVVAEGTVITDGSGSTWTVNISQEVSAQNIGGQIPVPQEPTIFSMCYVNSTPVNSEGTPDVRSSVKIDDVTQVPPNPPSPGVWTWTVPQGSTISCNLNISPGSLY